MKTPNYYARAIDILMEISNSSSIDVNDIIVQIAKTHPSVLVKTIEKIGGFSSSTPQYLKEMDKVYAQYGREKKIAILKMYRNATGCTLKESMDFVNQRYHL